MLNILRWDKPKKVMTAQQWGQHYGFDGGPMGGYSPNMSEADQLSWKAKITGKKLGFPQVEIRKTTNHGSQVVIIVNLGEGYNYKYYRAVDEKYDKYADFNDYVNQEAAKTFKDYPDLYKSVDEVKEEYYEDFTEEEYLKYKHPTRGINVHIATNGPIQMSFEEMMDMQKAIEEAKIALNGLAIAPSYAQSAKSDA